ncbi:MAG: PAS domain-containing sensor histidine kinase [Proteobacteria bacterium]|nr:PAS domain-containing sensor histidine kinase [Pseudomonadota bacterium]MBU4296402.1 PAS domain-containing sensor histidine kinase [Pseudomonadota bacterium]MCG2748672.1 PAS domain-containing sensor histidine kinase [Desulfobulbaceae bacterium]
MQEATTPYYYIKISQYHSDFPRCRLSTTRFPHQPACDKSIITADIQQGVGMKTYFAPAERCTREKLQEEIRLISCNPVIDGLMKSLSGLIAVLDEQRQVLAVNDTMLKILGYPDANEVLGLRPGEILHCVHAHEEPWGCGTTKSCMTCGAAIAIVSCLEKNKPQDRICVATVIKDGKEIDLCFQVRTYPINFEGHRFLLLFMHDITNQQVWASLERVFFHDINNILSGLMGTSEMLPPDAADHKLVKTLQQLLLRLKNEIDIQRVLSQSKTENYQMVFHQIPIVEVVQELRNFFANHPAAKGKTLTFPLAIPDVCITTDCSLLLRVLTNMVINAFEATGPAGEVKIRINTGEKNIAFTVWNDQPIPENIHLRIFKRHFSTKPGDGRGIGTFSMKLFGEDFLKGKVDFTSSVQDGTVFRFTLPRVSA